MNKFRKKGQLFIEYIIVLPLMIISLWLILQLIVYVYANNQVDHAADAGAKLVAQELRGTTGSFGSQPNKDQIFSDLHLRLSQALDNNGFVLYSKLENGDDSTIGHYKPMVVSESACNSALQDNNDTRVICILTKSINVGGRSHEQVVVKVKVPFKIIGNFVPGLDGKVFLYGTGTATKDISGRFQYY